MRTILIGAVGSTEAVLRAMQEAGCPPILLATLNPELGQKRHADYVDLAPMATKETQVVYANKTNNPDFIDLVRELSPDIILVIGWSQIIEQELRSAAKYCIGFHPTLLPQLRGRAAIGWTILLGLSETGATLFQIDGDVDNGPILAQMKIPLGERETVSTLIEKLLTALAQMIQSLLPKLADGTAKTQPQPIEGISYCARRTADDNLIDWTAGSVAIDRLIRASSPPYSGAFSFTRKRRVIIWKAEPCLLPHPYHAAAGQIVTYIDGNPIIQCGDGEFLRILEYDAGSTELKGQIRFRDRMDDQE